MSTLSILFFGLLLGMRHATEADHLAAVATLATRQSTLAGTVRQGVAWGVGHALTLMLFGGIILLLGRTISHSLGQALEVGVALMLIGLGIDVIRRRRSLPVAVVERRDVHPVGYSMTQASRQRWPIRATAVGMMHGMAGSAALILLSLDAVASPAIGVVYIAVFGIGSIAGMALLSAAIAVPLSFGGTGPARVRSAASLAVGLFTVSLGGTMLWRFAFAAPMFV